MLQEVTAMLQGFQTARRTLQLSVGQNAGIDIMLALGAVSETIEVSASALGVETRSSVLGTLVTREQIENQPLKTFDPSITKQFYLNSQRDKSVQLRLEAFNVLNRANFAIPTVGNLTDKPFVCLRASVTPWPVKGGEDPWPFRN